MSKSIKMVKTPNVVGKKGHEPQLGCSETVMFLLPHLIYAPLIFQLASYLS